MNSMTVTVTVFANSREASLIIVAYQGAKESMYWM
jgi:hypothetical protein